MTLYDLAVKHRVNYEKLRHFALANSMWFEVHDTTLVVVSDGWPAHKEAALMEAFRMTDPELRKKMEQEKEEARARNARNEILLAERERLKNIKGSHKRRFDFGW